MEHIRKLPMRALKCFYFVAHYGSMSLAANKLCVTHGAVSKQVKRLETYLKVTLFTKRGRKLVLTPSGVQLQQCCRPLFSNLEETLSQLSGHQNRTLIVSCEPTIAMKWLIPRSAEFKQASGIEVVILVAGGPVDFTRQRVDVAIRRDDFNWSLGLDSHYLTDEEIGVVQSSRGSYPDKLHTHTRPEAWEDWLTLSGTTQIIDDSLINRKINESGEMHFEHFYLSIQAAIAGLGQAIASKLMVQDDLDTQILIAPQGFVKDGSAYHLLSESPIANDENKQAFLNWLKQQMGT